jgi:hypothetical protein
MFFDAQPHSSRFDPPDSRLRFRMGFAELLWREWFETMSQVAYHTHRACELFVQNGGPSNGRFGPFDFHSSRSASEGPNDSIDMDKLKQCLQSMNPIQAARVMHAVQTMQAMEDMLQRHRSRANEADGAAW